MSSKKTLLVARIRDMPTVTQNSGRIVMGKASQVMGISLPTIKDSIARGMRETMKLNRLDTARERIKRNFGIGI